MFPRQKLGCAGTGDVHTRIRMKLTLFTVIGMLATTASDQLSGSPTTKHPFTFEDMMKLKRGWPAASFAGREMGRVRLRGC